MNYRSGPTTLPAVKNSSVAGMVMLGVSANGSHGRPSTSSCIAHVPAAAAGRKQGMSSASHGTPPQLGLNNGSAADGCRHCQEHETGGSNAGERIPLDEASGARTTAVSMAASLAAEESTGAAAAAAATGPLSLRTSCSKPPGLVLASKKTTAGFFLILWEPLLMPRRGGRGPCSSCCFRLPGERSVASIVGSSACGAEKKGRRATSVTGRTRIKWCQESGVANCQLTRAVKVNG